MSALTSLRFFAAIYVVFHHTFVIKSFLTYIGPDSVFGKLFTLGYVSVSFFFLLSGYILGVVYLQRGTEVNRRSFYLARFARVYPLFFLTLILDTPNLYFIKVAQYGQMGGLVRTVIRFFAATFMIQAWYVQWRGIDNPNWSLSAEAFFYLVFPFVGVVLWRARGASLWMAAAAVYLGGQALILLVAPHLDAETSPYLPALHLSTFMLGILLARWQTLNAKAALPGRASVGLAPNVVSVICLALFGMAVNWSSILPRYFWFDGILAPVFVAFGVVGGASAQRALAGAAGRGELRPLPDSFPSAASVPASGLGSERILSVIPRHFDWIEHRELSLLRGPGAHLDLEALECLACQGDCRDVVGRSMSGVACGMCRSRCRPVPAL
jgi:peptidoglycan/LPS O-acetylase OafA/YrhL